MRLQLKRRVIEKTEELATANQQLELANKKMAKTIINCTKNKDQKIVTLDSLQAVKQEQIDKGYSYLKAMKHNLKVLKKCLE